MFQTNLKLLESDLEKKQETLVLHRDRIQKIGAELNELGKEKLEIERGAQKTASLKENLRKITVDLDQHKMEIESLQVELEPLKNQLEDLQRNKRRFQMEKEKQVLNVSYNNYI